MMRLRDISAQPLPPPLADIVVAGLAYDSRHVQPGFLFAAWRGARADGHQFVQQAVQRGAAVILAERELPQAGVPVWVVADVRATLAALARRFFGDPSADLRMVAVTGTNGKTTSVHLLEAIFAAAGWRPGVIGTLGCRYGAQQVESGLTTPESVDLVALLRTMAMAGTDAVAMEASSQALDQHRVDGVRFDTAIFTNLTQDHLDYHHTQDAYFAAKARLFTHLLKHDATAVINADDPWSSKITTSHVMTFSQTQPNATVFLQNAQLNRSGITMSVRTPRGTLALRSPLLGAFNVANILGCVGAGLALDISDAALVAGIAQLAHVPGRLERVSSPQDPLVLVDYAHTPDAVQQVLAAVGAVTSGRVLCVFGCGGDRDPHKRAPMGRAAMAGAYYALLTNDNPRHEDPQVIAATVEQGLRQAGGTRTPTVTRRGYDVVLDREAAIGRAIAAAQPADAIVILGKGHETYQIVGSTKHVFDDRDVARHHLAARHRRVHG